jgi:hypothetical protein
MRIGQGVLVDTEEHFMVVLSVLGRQSFPGSVGSKDQLTLSSAEAKYMATILAACEAIWLRKLLVGVVQSGDWSPRSYTVTIRAMHQALLKIQCFVTTPSTSRSGTTTSETVFSRGKVRPQYVPTGGANSRYFDQGITNGQALFYFRDKFGVVQNTFLSKREC